MGEVYEVSFTIARVMKKERNGVNKKRKGLLSSDVRGTDGVSKRDK